MTGTLTTSWSESDFCLASGAAEAEQHLADLVATVYERVCRTDFLAPGFCLLNLGTQLSSQQFRHIMLALERAMRPIHRARLGRDLVLLSAGRFDQQATTKPHRDGGPDECFLMLGYEPSTVQADLLMSDYSRYAYDLGMTPREFLDKHNPMFVAGECLLEGYTTRVSCFCNENYQILFVNNSNAPFSAEVPAWQGVLHTAVIRNPDASARRVVNSVMVASVPVGVSEAISESEQEEFMQTEVVRRPSHANQT
jgi:hypothetical protein